MTTETEVPPTIPRTATTLRETATNLKSTHGKPNWTMPRPGSGIVLWCNGDKSGGKRFALVDRIYDSSIDITLFGNGMTQGRQGVKHIDDPSLKVVSVPNSGGLFEITPFEQDLNKLLRKDA